ncbi:23S rRNA (uracil(1939)-C(5))-methyltransferase RlmD [Endothiovibrio diazotrophicus]
MARRRRSRKQRLPADPVEATIDSMAHDGRGVAHLEGKAVFIDGALPGERVTFFYTSQRRSHDEGKVEAVLDPAVDRVAARCEAFGLCGGCALQHLEEGAQIGFKQQTLLENLKRIGKVEPEQVLEPLTGPHWGYRRKARLGVRDVPKKGRVLVGFREKHSPYLADFTRCQVLHPAVGMKLEAISECIGALSVHNRVAQIEVSIGARGGEREVVALVFRNLDPLTAGDEARLRAFGLDHGFDIYLQSGGPDTVVPLSAGVGELSYTLPEFDVELFFGPMDFTQVNNDINRAMVSRALAMLDPKPEERILDLFCGLGNFTLPIARRAGKVVGVEGDAELVRRAGENAARNGISNAEFHTADLTRELTGQPWLAEGIDKLLIDPPRSGALEVIPHAVALKPRRIVYVSCNPATLARDAGELVHAHGYRLLKAGVMDMFPHTGHVESIALFEK